MPKRALILLLTYCNRVLFLRDIDPSLTRSDT